MNRAAVKTLLETGLDASGFTSALRWHHRRRDLVLAFHNVLAPGEAPGGDRPLHLPLADFEAMLDELARTHEIVPLRALAAPAPARRRPRAAITFDDAYRGAVQHGLAALAARGLPSTIFVAPGILGEPGCWWDEITMGAHGIDPATKRWALEELRGDPARVRASTPEAQQHGRRFPIATEAELATHACAPLVTLAPHSWTHRNLARLTAEELRHELADPLAWLRERFTNVEPAVAYPYGSTAPAVEAAAAALGYAWGFRADYGWLPAEPAGRFDLRRFTVGAGASLRNFRQRCAGLPPR